MKKGTNPSQILRLIYNIKDKNPSLVISSNEFKNEVIDEYNRIYSISSIDTIVSNLREDAILHFQDEYKLGH